MKRNLLYILMMSLFLLSGCQTTNPTLYQIEFDANGGETVEAITASTNDTIILPETSKQNANFKGWFDKVNPSSSPITQLTQINQNIVLIAKWEIDVSYYDKDSNLIEVMSYELGSSNNLTNQLENGLDFLGWFDSSEVNHQNTDTLSGHTNLYEKWMITVDYESNSLSMIGSTQHALYDNETLPIPVKEHYTFQGWFLDSQLTQEVRSTSTLLSHSTLYGKWMLSDDYIALFDLDEQERGYVIIGMHEMTSTIIIPSTINGIEVIGISDYAFSNQLSITQIIFEENSNIEFIGVEAFKGTSIVSLVLPESVTTIKFGAFKDVSTLVDVVFSSNLETLEKEAFTLTKWYQQLKNYLFIVNDIMFFYKGDEQQITIPNEVTTIYDYAFEGNTSVKTIHFEEGSQVSTFSKFTFYGSKIETIDIPNSLLEIQERSFENHLYLKTLNFNEASQLITIGDHAFEKSGLTNATFPQTVQSIGIDAFSQTPWLGEYLSDFVVISDILVRFKGHITTVTIPNNVRIIGPKAMAFNFVKHVIISNSVERIEKQAFIGTHLDSVTFEDNSKLSYIGHEAFLNNYVKGDILLPPSIELIEDGAFSNCIYLKSIHFTSEIPPKIGDILMPTDVVRIKIYVPLASLEIYQTNLDFEQYLSIILS